MRPARAVLSCIGLALLLAACDSISEDQCRAGDWRGIGFSDGAAGRDADYISRHQQACAKIGITPDLTAWLAGREQGLQRYCIPQKAYEEGRLGRSLSPVCPAALQSGLREANAAGRNYYDIGLEIDQLDRDRRGIEDALDALPDDAGSERRRLRDERSRLDRRIGQLERDRLRYEDWPL